MLIAGYIASILYISLAFKRIFVLKICIGFLVVNVILFGILFNIKNEKIKNLISYLQVFLISLTLNLKVVLLYFYYSTQENDHYSEIIRVITYDFVSANLFLILKSEANIFLSLGFNSMNIFSSILSEVYSNEEHFYFLYMLIGTFLTLIFFAFRKAWDYRLRVIFSEKYKSDKLVLNTFEYINGLNGFHINLKENNQIFIDEKFLNFLNFILINDENKLNGNISLIRDAENNLGQPDSNLFHLESLNLVTYFLSKLKPYLSDSENEIVNEIKNKEDALNIKNSKLENEKILFIIRKMKLLMNSKFELQF